MKRNFFMLLVIILVLVFAVACSEPALELTSVRDYEEENLINYFNGLQTILLSSVQVWDAHPDSVGDMISGEYDLDFAQETAFFDVTWNNFDFEKVEEGLTIQKIGMPGRFVIVKGFFKATPFEEGSSYTLEATIKLNTMLGFGYYEIKFRGTFNDEGQVGSAEYAIINGVMIDPDNYMASFGNID